MINKDSVVFGNGVIEKIPSMIKNSKSEKALVVYDLKAEKHALSLIEALKKEDVFVKTFILTGGEKEKSLIAARKISELLFKFGFCRSDTLVAVGGGVTGDLGGFVASLYMRGMKLVLVPTTLLAACDSAIGGKNGVDFLGAKNVLGSFYLPSHTVIDYGVLSALPDTVKKEAEGEILKYALLDEGIFNLVEKESPLSQIVAACVDYKISVCNKDLFDKGERRVLNLGHTIAHAIEALSDFKITHGEAVAQGLFFISALSQKHGLISDAEYRKISRLLLSHGVKAPSFTPAELAAFALADKKRDGEKLSLVMLKRVGEPIIVEVNCEKIKEYYEY